MNNHHDLTWRDRRIFTERRPVPYVRIAVALVFVFAAAFMAGVWSA